MIKFINLANKKSTIEVLEEYKNSNGNFDVDIKILNSHIRDLNAILNKNVFKKNTLFIHSQTLWEIMQPVGGKGQHNYHGLSPNNVYDALTTIRFSNDVTLSYGDRYLIITLATVFDDINIAIVITPKGTQRVNPKKSINKVITIYPYKKK